MSTISEQLIYEFFKNIMTTLTNIKEMGIFPDSLEHVVDRSYFTLFANRKVQAMAETVAIESFLFSDVIRASQPLL